MARLSINAAAKTFAVSRPTILKHLQSGKISGDKDPETGHWTIDESELSRAYPLREKDSDLLADNYTSRGSAMTVDLHAKIERLERDLAVAEALAEERGRRLEDQDERLEQTLKLLEGPQKPPKRRKWWPFG